MKTANRNRSLFLRTALVAIPLAFASLAPASAVAEPRPTPVPHNGSLVRFVSQHSAADPAPTKLSQGSNQSRPEELCKDPKPASHRRTNDTQTDTSTSAGSSVAWHSWEWSVDGGPGA